MKQENTFSWLHFTDLHFGLGGQGPLWSNIKHAFFEDMKVVHEHTGPWDVVLFSGDFVQKGAADEFTRLNDEVLHPLWDRMKELGSEPTLLAVPGNHDLSRPQGKKTAAYKMMVDKGLFHDIADDFFDDPTGEYRKIVTGAFANYSAWWDKAPYRHPTINSGALPGDMSATIEVGDFRVGIVGLNTTFLQLEEGDFSNRLAWDLRQFNAATTGQQNGDGAGWIKQHHVSLLMTHQGPEWLNDHSRNSVYPEINPAGRFAVHLFGHMHESVIRGLSAGGGEFLWQWQGNSLFGLGKFGSPPKEDRRHGYSAGMIRFRADGAALRHWPRKASKDTNGWRLDRDSQGCKLEDRDGGTRDIPVPLNKQVQVEKNASAKGEGSKAIPASYTRWLAEQCADITPFGMAPTDGQSVCLQQVYVPSLTTKRMDSEELASKGGLTVRHARGSTVEQFELKGVRLDISKQGLLLSLLGEQSLYISGDPGSGRSTFCRWISWVTSTGQIPSFVVEAPDEFKETFPESLRGRLPLVVRLREFGAYLPAQPGRKTLSTVEFESALEKWIETTKPGGLRWNDVALQLKAGSLLLILDGVDELPLSEGDGKLAWSPRESVLAGIATAALEWIAAGNRLLVTSRPYGVEADQVRMLDRSGLPEARIERLPEPLQDLLATRWFVALPKTSAEGAKSAQDMLREVRQLSQGIDVLAGNPLLLTAICIIYGEGMQLPRDIHELYDRIVTTSLHSRYPRDRRLIEPVRARLAAVALGMHTGDPVEPKRTVPEAEVPFDELDQILAKYRGANLETEAGFKDHIDAREDLLNHSGLISQGSSKRAGFYHLSFQEFLAAEQLARRNEGVERLLDVYIKRAEIPNWRPTLRFLMARRASVQGHKAVIELLDEMLTKIDNRKIAKFLGLAQCALDGLSILLERGLHLQPELIQRFKTIFLKSIDQQVEPKARLEFALMLGRIGDPRVPASLRDDSAWVNVPAGNYTYGDDNQRLQINQSFQISKYPVTNAQFAEFVNSRYSDEGLWHPVGWKWRMDRGYSAPEYWQDKNWNAPNLPVVGVSWWEADAFCRWAGVRLPTEHEWEAAARGPEGREYPWSNTWQEGFCNSAETGLSRTSPVGMFPKSASFCGAHDMAGNVWEWCSDHYAPSAKENESAGRVLRGGSWDDLADACRSSIRDYDPPVHRVVSIGFRVARTL